MCFLMVPVKPRGSGSSGRDQSLAAALWSPAQSAAREAGQREVEVPALRKAARSQPACGAVVLGSPWRPGPGTWHSQSVSKGPPRGRTRLIHRPVFLGPDAGLWRFP